MGKVSCKKALMSRVRVLFERKRSLRWYKEYLVRKIMAELRIGKVSYKAK